MILSRPCDLSNFTSRKNLENVDDKRVTTSSYTKSQRKQRHLTLQSAPYACIVWKYIFSSLVFRKIIVQRLKKQILNIDCINFNNKS